MLAAAQQAARRGVSVSMAAKIYFNSAETVTAQLKSLDLALKSEILFYELSSTVYWISQLELVVFYFGAVIWFSQVSALGTLWLHIMHVPRSLVGILLVVNMPNTHDLITDVAIPPKEKIQFDRLASYVTDSAMKSFMSFYDANARYLKGYLILTLVAWFLDLISFFIACHKYGESDLHDAYPATILFVFGVVYLALDTYYIWWVISLKLKLPDYIFRPVFKALGGLGDQLVRVVEARIGRGSGP